MQCNVGLPQHVLGGMAQPKVGTEGKRGEEFGQSYAGCFHVPIVRLRSSFVRRRNWRWYAAVDVAIHVASRTVVGIWSFG